ncbi:MAG TPA: ATP-binding protein [Gemmatimonadaceae bacterium]|jgi:PAS domain S-box-containing protein|nr:ATP-binding protein [Gemmatimonadaceae bacterium]
MTDKAEKHPLSDRPPKVREPDTPTPITPIGNSRLSETIKHGGRIYQLMVESVRDYAIFMLDPSGYIASWNRGAERINGYSSGEIIGRHFSVFYPQVDIDAGKPAYELEVAARDGRLEDEGIRLRKDGTAFWATVIITAVRDTDGSLIGFAKVTRDLTERRAAEQRAIADARRVAESEHANSAKMQFLTAMSHELRTPLNAIGGYTDLLSMGLGGPITAEQLDYLDRIRRSQQHLMAIISDLLNFSRIEAGHVTYDITPILLPQILDVVLTMVEPQSLAKGVRVRRAANAKHAIALGDRSKVAQILVNVLSNAIKFTETGGRVTVDISTTDNTASISVADTGCGIAPDKLESIFEPFVQLGRSLSSSHEGTGLGLAISRDLAYAMNGNLTVTSTEGVGSTFTLTLPLAG